MTRKEFLRTTGLCWLGMAAAGCRGLVYFPVEDPQGRPRIPLAAFEERPYLVVQLLRFREPVLVVALPEGTYAAFLMKCTHRGCELQPVGEELHCPCHGSTFNLQGEVLEGPAERPLPTIKTLSDETHLYFLV